RTIDPDFEHLLRRAQTRIFAVVLDIGSIPAEPRQNRFSRLGMQTHFAGQREKRKRADKIDVLRLCALRDRSSLGLLFAVRVTNLNVRTEAASTQRDLKPSFGIGAKHLGLAGDGGLLAVGIGDLASVAAVRIVGAANKRPEFPDLETEPPVSAGRTG